MGVIKHFQGYGEETNDYDKNFSVCFNEDETPDSNTIIKTYNKEDFNSKQNQDMQPNIELNFSEDIGELAKALSKLQTEVPQIPRTKTVTVKTRTGGKYSFDYAPLDVMVEKLRAPLKEQELAVTQLPQGENSLFTMIMHSSGQWVYSVASPNVKDGVEDMQDYGSQMTYLRRYSLESALFFVASTDDDSNYSSGNTIQNEKSKKVRSESRQSKKQDGQDKATARDLKGVKDSTDMNVQPAIAYIRDTAKDKLEGFVTEDEDRITILRVWDSKMGTNLSGEFGSDDSESSKKSQKTETKSDSSDKRSVSDAIDAIINDDNLEPNEKVNKLVGGIYQVHTNPSHDKFDDREFDQYDPDEFQDKYYSVIQEAITKVQN